MPAPFVQVYAIACYIEGAKAAKEFGIRARGGFFQDAGISDYADAVLDAACGKVIAMRLVRDVEGEPFIAVRPSRTPAPPTL